MIFKADKIILLKNNFLCLSVALGNLHLWQKSMPKKNLTRQELFEAS